MYASTAVLTYLQTLARCVCMYVCMYLSKIRVFWCGVSNFPCAGCYDCSPLYMYFGLTSVCMPVLLYWHTYRRWHAVYFDAVSVISRVPVVMIVPRYICILVWRLYVCQYCCTDIPTDAGTLCMYVCMYVCICLKSVYFDAVSVISRAPVVMIVPRCICILVGRLYVCQYCCTDIPTDAGTLCILMRCCFPCASCYDCYSFVIVVFSALQCGQLWFLSDLFRLICALQLFVRC